MKFSHQNTHQANGLDFAENRPIKIEIILKQTAHHNYWIYHHNYNSY